MTAHRLARNSVKENSENVMIHRTTKTLLALIVVISAAFAAPAQAAPIWDIAVHHGPSSFEPGSTGEYTFLVNNVGDSEATGPIALAIDLPDGVTLRETTAGFASNVTWWGGYGAWTCPTEPGESQVTCDLNVLPVRAGAPAGGSGHGEALTVYVDIAPEATGPVTVEATATTGNAGPATVTHQTPVGPEPTAFGLQEGSLEADAFDRNAIPVRQAAAHPYRAVVGFDLARRNRIVPAYEGSLELVPAPNPFGGLRNVEVLTPRGLVGNPQVVAKCTPRRLAQLPPAGAPGARCPADSQIGTVQLVYADLGTGPGAPPTPFTTLVYNMEPPPGALAAFGFQVFDRTVYIVASLDPRDHSVVASVRNVNETLPVHYQRLTLWGVPGDPAHNPMRLDPNTGNFGTPFGGQVKPFLTLPSECGVEDTTDITSLVSWQNSELSVGPYSSEPIELSGCEQLVFEPTMTVQPTTRTPDSPTGLEVDLSMPQQESVSAPGTPPLRDARVVLPEGMSINPAVADGLKACTDAQLGLGTNNPIGCPAGAKVGTVTAKSPALEETIEGGVYIRSQNSSDPESGEMFRLALVLENKERGLLVKLPGAVKVDEDTGRIETAFEDNPQLPVSSIKLNLKTGPRAPLATPDSCGVKTTDIHLTSWAGQTVDATDSFTIPCPVNPGFSPAFEAGSVSPVGGSFSPFVARIERAEGQQYLSRIDIDMPKGLIAKLRGVRLCPDAVAGDGTPGVCPAGSRIGTATVGAGSGSPFYLQGPVYLTGPYKGAPYGLSVQVPAKAGPFDLGMVKVRNALHVDPETAQITVASDRLPTIVKGVPVRLRSVNVNVNRPGFTINPTSCAEKQIGATFTSTQGAVSKTSSRFQVGDCRALAFKPKLAMRMTGKRQRKTGGHPGLKVSLTQKAGQANLKGVAVKLPKSLALDPDNAQGLCNYLEARKPDPKCPASSIVGRATAYTPVLNKPLTGPVYFAEHKEVNRFGRLISKLPSLVIPLRGEVAINIRQRSDVKGGRLVSTTASIPDAPVSKFNLSLKGGKGGIITVTRNATRKFNICTGKQTALVETDAQNGRRADFPVRAKTPCTKAAKRTKKSKG